MLVGIKTSFDLLRAASAMIHHPRILLPGIVAIRTVSRARFASAWTITREEACLHACYSGVDRGTQQHEQLAITLQGRLRSALKASLDSVSMTSLPYVTVCALLADRGSSVAQPVTRPRIADAAISGQFMVRTL